MSTRFPKLSAVLEDDLGPWMLVRSVWNGLLDDQLDADAAARW